MIKIYGVQRTGTNYLTALIEKNIKVEVFTHDFGWKHGDVAWPSQYLVNTENKRSVERQEYLRKLISNKRLIGIVLIKNPYTWIKSIERYAKKCWPHELTIEEYFNFYNQRYKGYLEFWNTPTTRWGYKHFFPVIYENLLSDLAGEVRRIGKFCGIDVGSVEDVGRVEQSQRFTEEMREFYLNPVESESVSKFVDWKTMGYYGYKEKRGVEEYEILS
jgi:hypothetical protein